MPIQELSRKVRHEDKAVTVTIKGSKENVDRVLALLSFLELNGGHSGVFGISWDGDGADAVSITGADFSQYRDLVSSCSSHGGEVEYVGENGTGHVLSIPPGQKRRVKVWPKDDQ